MAPEQTSFTICRGKHLVVIQAQMEVPYKNLLWGGE